MLGNFWALKSPWTSREEDLEILLAGRGILGNWRLRVVKVMATEWNYGFEEWEGRGHTGERGWDAKSGWRRKERESMMRIKM